MPTPSGLVTKQELIDAQLDTAHLGRVVNSKDASGAPISTSTNRTGGVNKTLDALETGYLEAIRAAGGVSLGAWTAGVTTFTKYNEYAVFNGIPYKPRTSTALPYVAQGADPTTAPDDANVQPYTDVTQEYVTGVTNLQAASVSDMIAGITVGGGEVLRKLGQVWSVTSKASQLGAGPLIYKITTDIPNNNNIIDVGSGLSATIINDRSFFLDLSKWGVENGDEISSKLQSAVDYLVAIAPAGVESRGVISIPSGWQVSVTSQVNWAPGIEMNFQGSRLTVNSSSIAGIRLNHGFWGARTKFKIGELYGIDTTPSARAAAGSYGILVTGGVPFIDMDIDVTRYLKWPWYLQDAYSSRVKIGRAFQNKFNGQFQDECHASSVDFEMCEEFDDIGLVINDGAATSFVHNITFRGAYQKGPRGVVASKCYEVWGENIYQEQNTVADIQFGVADAGVYARAAYNCGVRTWQSESAVGTGGNGNFILEHAVGINLRDLTLLSNVSASDQITFDGFCNNIKAQWAFLPGGQTPNINSIDPSARERLWLELPFASYVPKGVKGIRHRYDDTIEQTTYTQDASGTGRPESRNDFIGTNADRRNRVTDREFFEDSAGTKGLLIDHLNDRIEFGYPAYTSTGDLVTSDPREKYDINVCSLGSDFIRDLVDSGGVIDYRLKSGESGRLHSGVRTDVLKSVGLKHRKDLVDFAMYAEFDQINQSTGKPTGEKREAARYEELIAPMMMYIRDLEKRLEILEGK